MSIVVVTPPASEPVTLDEVMYHCRIDDYSQEAASEIIMLSGLIAAARRHAENELDRYLITQTLDAYYDGFQEVFKLPPLQSVSSITYYDTAGVEQTLSSSNYQVDSASKPARITVSYGNTWPSTRTQNNAVKIRFIAGYGDAADVPDCIKNWMLMRIKTLYDGRDQLISHNGELSLTQMFVDGLLDPERVYGYD